MSIHETIGEKKRALTVLALSGAASLALAACGDSGSSEISACPDGYAKGSTPVKQAPTYSAIQRGVAELRADINPDTYSGNEMYSKVDPQYQGAAVDIFNKDDNLGAYNVLEIASGETHVDDLSEVFCISDGEVYLSPEARQAVSAMNFSGINVNPVPANQPK